MKSCTPIPLRHSRLRGARLGCAPATLADGSLHKAGPRREEPSQLPPASSGVTAQSYIHHNGRQRAERTGIADAAVGIGKSGSRKLAQAAAATAVVARAGPETLPPLLVGVAGQSSACFSSDGSLQPPGYTAQSHAEHLDQQQPHQQQYRHQLARGSPQAAVSRELLLGSAVLSLQQPQQQQPGGPVGRGPEAPHAAAVGDVATVQVHGSCSATLLHSLPSQLPQPLQHQHQLQPQHHHHAGPSHQASATWADQGPGDGGVPLVPFLDAASRSGGAASTSDSFPPGHGPGQAPKASGRRRSAGRVHANGHTHDRAAAGVLVQAPPAGEAAAMVLAGPPAGVAAAQAAPSTGSSRQGSSGRRPPLSSSSSSSSSAAREDSGSSNGVYTSSAGSSSSSSNGSSSFSSNSSKQNGKQGMRGTSTAAAALARCSEVETQPEPAEGATHYLPPSHPEAGLIQPSPLLDPPEGDVLGSSSDDVYGGNSDVYGGSPDGDTDAAREPGWRAAPPAGRRARARPGPRGYTPEEHAVLRMQAQQARESLQPRAPTHEDLRLTVRVTCALHWHEVLVALSQHERACLEQRARRQQEHWVRAHAQEEQREPGSAQQPRQLRGKQAEQQQPGRGRGSRWAAAAPAGMALLQPGAPSETGGGRAGGHREPQRPLLEPSGGVPPVAELPFTPQHVAATLARTAHLVSRLGGAGSAEEAQRLSSLVERLARMALELLPSPGMGMRELVTVFHSLVRLRHPVGKAYFVALMGAARVRFSAKPPPVRGVAWQRKQQPPPQSIAAGAREGGLPYSAHDMSLLIWCVAGCGMERLRPDWAAAYGRALLPTVPYMTAQGVSLVLYSMARLDCKPAPEVLEALCGRLAQLCAGDPPPPQEEQQQRGEAGEAVAAAQGQGAGQGHDRLVGVVPAAPQGAGCAQRQEQAAMKGQEERVQEPVQQRPQRPGGAFGAWAGDVPAAAPGAADSAAVPARALDGFDPRLEPGPAAPPCLCRPVDVCMALWALATLRLQPDRYCPRLLPALEAYSLARLPRFDQQDLSTVVWAPAKLKHTPGAAWLDSLYSAVLLQLGELQPRVLAMLLYGLASMGQRPPAEWLGGMVARAREVLPEMTPQALALTVHALATMGYQPGDSWLAAFHAQLEAHRGRLDTRVRDKVREAYRLLNFRPGAAPPTQGAGARRADAAQLQRRQRERSAAAREAGQRAGREGGDLDAELAAPPVETPVEAHAQDVAVMVKPSRFGF